MTDTHSSRIDLDTPPGARPVAPQRTGWTGWIGFGAFMLLLVGFFQAIQGLAAIFNPDYYKVAPSGLVVHVNYTVWGWTHLALGVLLFLAGVGLFSGNRAARAVAVVAAVLSALANLAFITAQPAWSLVVITLDVLVIYAVIVHGREMEGTL